MTIEDIISSTEILDPKRQYWFFRTDGGRFFEEFYNENFIAIGWNTITIDDIKNRKKDIVRNKIAIDYEIDMSKKSAKTSISLIYNQIENFNNLRKGSVVVMPSRSSSRLAFGIIDDDTTYINNKVSESDGCGFYKRRKINWLKTREISSLDAKFYQMITGRRQTISNLKGYEPYIDNITNNLFFKKDSAHFVVNIKQNEDINIKSLVSFIDSMQKLASKVNEHFDLKEDIEASTIKLNLQSPGLINFKFPSGKTLVILATILTAYSCGDSSKIQKEPLVDSFVQANTSDMDSINNDMRTLDSIFERVNN